MIKKKSSTIYQGFPYSSVGKKVCLQCRRLWFQFLGWEDPLEKGQATHSSVLGLPLWLSWERIHLQCGRPGFDPWVGKILWRRKQLPTPVFWPGELHGLYSSWGRKESDRTEGLSLSPYTKLCTALSSSGNPQDITTGGH